MSKPDKQLQAAQRIFGDHRIIVETDTAQPPVKGLSPVSGQQGLYCWQSENKYHKQLASVLVDSLRKREDIINCYAQIEETES